MTIAKNAVIGVQIPSYTSATHMWHGNAEILKRKPNRIQINANSTSQTLSKKIELPKKI